MLAAVQQRSGALQLGPTPAEPHSEEELALLREEIEEIEGPFCKNESSSELNRELKASAEQQARQRASGPR